MLICLFEVLANENIFRIAELAGGRECVSVSERYVVETGVQVPAKFRGGFLGTSANAGYHSDEQVP